MKHFIFGTLFLLLSTFGAFAQDDMIDVSISSSDILLHERVKYIVNISEETPGNFSGEINIPGIENFNIFSQSNGYSFESINGVSRGVSQYTFDMSPKQVGEFTLGPIEITTASGSIIDDEKLFVEVGEEQVSNSLNRVNENRAVENSNESEIQADFHTLREIKIPQGLIVITALSFFIFFYFLLSLAFGKKKTVESKKEKQKHEDTMSFNDEMIKYFKKLDDKSGSLSHSNYLKVFNRGIRMIFENHGIYNAMSMTLTEMQGNEIFKKSALSKLFQKTYKAEYSQRELTAVTKKKYSDEVLAYLR